MLFALLSFLVGDNLWLLDPRRMPYLGRMALKLLETVHGLMKIMGAACVETHIKRGHCLFDLTSDRCFVYRVMLLR